MRFLQQVHTMRDTMRWVGLTAALAAAAGPGLAQTRPAARASAGRPQPAAVRGAYAVMQAADTFVVESFVRVPRPGGDSIAAEMRVPRQRIRVRQYVIDSAGLVPRYVSEAFAPNAPAGAPAAQRLVLRIAGDSAVGDANGAVQRVRVTPGVLPWANPSIVLLELMVRRSRAAGGAVNVPVINVAGAGQFTATVTPLGRDSVLVAFPDVQLRVAVDAAGRVTGARAPSQNVTVYRLPGR